MIDPDGREVKFAGFKEWLDVQVAKVFSKEFRQEFKHLKNDEDKVFTFKYNGKESSSPGTNGDIEHTGFNGDRQETLTINYTKTEKNDLGGLGRSKMHALFEETFHAADYSTGRNSQMRVGPDPSNPGRNIVGQISGDRSTEARAWMFAAKNAPFVPSVVDIEQPGTGIGIRYNNPLVRRMKSASQSQVESWLYGTYNVNYSVPSTGYTGTQTFKGPY